MGVRSFSQKLEIMAEEEEATTDDCFACSLVHVQWRPHSVVDLIFQNNWFSR